VAVAHLEHTAIEVPSSHVAMLSFPKEVAELIIKAAEYALAHRGTILERPGPMPVAELAERCARPPMIAGTLNAVAEHDR
jgi:hypothetical protein